MTHYLERKSFFLPSRLRSLGRAGHAREGAPDVRMPKHGADARRSDAEFLPMRQKNLSLPLEGSPLMR
jgi:hypothetical protein